MIDGDGDSREADRGEQSAVPLNNFLIDAHVFLTFYNTQSAVWPRGYKTFSNMQKTLSAVNCGTN